MLRTCSFVILHRIIFHSTRRLYLCFKIVICHLFFRCNLISRSNSCILFSNGNVPEKIKVKFPTNNYAQPPAGIIASLHITRDNDLLFLLGIFGFYIKTPLQYLVTRYDMVFNTISDLIFILMKISLDYYYIKIIFIL